MDLYDENVVITLTDLMRFMNKVNRMCVQELSALKYKIDKIEIQGGLHEEMFIHSAAEYIECELQAVIED